MPRRSLIPEKYLRFISYAAIVAGIASIALILAAFSISHDTKKLFPIVLPAMTVLLAYLQLLLLNKQKKED